AVPGDARVAVVLPVEVWVDDHALWHAPGVVGLVAGKVLARVIQPVAEDRRAPVDLADDRPRVRVDQQLVPGEAQAARGLVRAVHAVAIELARLQARHIAVPGVGGHLAQPQPLVLVLVVRPVEQAKLDLGRVLRIEREVDTLAVPGRPEERWATW